MFALFVNIRSGDKHSSAQSTTLPTKKIMNEKLTGIELLVTKIGLEHKLHQFLKNEQVVKQRRVGTGLRVVELHMEKLRLERMRQTIQERRKYEHDLCHGRSGLIRIL